MSTQSPNPAAPAAAAQAGATKSTLTVKDFIIKFGLLIILAVTLMQLAVARRLGAYQ